MTTQVVLPDNFVHAPTAAAEERVWEIKRLLGDRLMILGHHYQMDEVVQFADHRGDSLKLAQQAAAQKDAEYIVFCGVHFMAETADIVTGPEQQVILPDLTAGCSMADMASIDQVEECWEVLEEVTGGAKIVPLTYINCTAEIKAFVGRHDGAICTSSNAPGLYRWALEHGDKILFMPDEHLGRNTGVTFGIGLDEMVVYDPLAYDGGVTPQQLHDARVILWKGCCSVHQRFNTRDVDQIRQAYPDMRIIVHPECPYEVVQAADDAGSTSYIISAVEASPAGSQWAIGTEIHLVNRLAAEHPDKTIVNLAEMMCLCATMYRIDLPHLHWVLEQLMAGEVTNQIIVPPDIARESMVALNRMMNIV